MITAAQVADLIEGDVVEIADERWPDTFVCGPLKIQDYVYSPGALCCRDIPVRSATGRPYGAPWASLTVLTRAPRPAPPAAVPAPQSPIEVHVYVNGQAVS